MEKYIKGMLLVLAAAFVQAANAQTLHVVVFCNTIDESIGKGMSVEYKNVLNQIQTLNTMLDYDMDLHKLDGPICTRANLQSIINDMEIEEDDIVFTFYGGHGSHAENNESDPWPQYLMNSGFENQSNWVPMATLAKWVKAKNARLSLVISNCCNKEQAATTIKPLWANDGRATELDGLNADNYRKLFSARGFVMATSSKLGQYSYCSDAYGGIFTNDFWNAMRMVGTGDVAADWESVLKKTYDMCSARQIRTNDYPYTAVQNPYYKVSVNGGSPVPPPPPTPKSSSLTEALASITNKKISENIRLNMIPTIENKYFDSGAKVITVGNDLETQFEYEDVRDFLRRICLSPYIKGVNVLNESRSLLKVHEVR